VDVDCCGLNEGGGGWMRTAKFVWSWGAPLLGVKVFEKQALSG